MKVPALSETTIRSHAMLDAFQRGHQYYHRGSVVSLIVRGTMLYGKVEGSQYYPYHVRIAYDNGGITHTICSCDYDSENGWCKHIVAVLLHCLYQPESITIRPELNETIASLNRTELETILLHILDYYPSLVESLEEHIALQTTADTSANSGADSADNAENIGSTDAHKEPHTTPYSLQQLIASKRQTPVDAEQYRLQVVAIFQTSSFVGQHDDTEYTMVFERLYTLLTQVRTFIAEGDGHDSLAILEAIIDGCLESGDDVLDVSIHAIDFCDEVGLTLAEALLTTVISFDERQQWVEHIEEWISQLDEYSLSVEGFRVARTAAIQGWDDMFLQQVLNGEVVSLVYPTAEKEHRIASNGHDKAALAFIDYQNNTDDPLDKLDLPNQLDLSNPLGVFTDVWDTKSDAHSFLLEENEWGDDEDDDDDDDEDDDDEWDEEDEGNDEDEDEDEDDEWDDDMLTLIRLNVLERQGKFQEYSNLALVTGLMQHYVLMQVRLGHIESAITDGLRYFTTADEALKLAKALREQHELDAALRVAEHGLTFQEPREPLASWMCELAIAMGETGRALYAAEVACRSHPSLSAYLRVQELADHRWAAIRDKLLASLRDHKTSWGDNRVDIFLHEGLIDDAIDAISDYSNAEVLQTVLDAALHHRPEWVVERACTTAERIVEQSKASQYRLAISYWQKARVAYHIMGREADWYIYLASIREQYHHKHKLIYLLQEFV